MPETAPFHDAADLTRRIETRYHRRHRAQLPVLLKMAEMVEDLHATDTGVPTGLHHALTGLSREMAGQMAREEAILFPAIRSGAGLETQAAVIRDAHKDQGRRIAEIRRLTRGLITPDGACTSWATLYAELAAFIDDLRAHMRLETEMLLPR